MRTAIGGAGLVLATEIVGPQPESAAASAAVATMIGVPFESKERVRLGIIGVGGRGTSLLRDLLAVENVDIKAICDVVPTKVEHAQKMVTDAGQAKPTGIHWTNPTAITPAEEIVGDFFTERGQAPVHGFVRRRDGELTVFDFPNATDTLPTSVVLPNLSAEDRPALCFPQQTTEGQEK